MGEIYSCAVRTSDTTANHAMVELYTGNVPCKVWEIGFSETVATTVMFALGVPTTSGASRGTIWPFLQEQNTGDPAAKTNLCTSWGASPIPPSLVYTSGPYYRMVYTTNTIGTSYVWAFARGLYVPTNSSLCLFNLGGAGVVSDVWFVIEE